MTTLRLLLFAILGLVIALPLGVSLLDLFLTPGSWSALTEVSRLLSLARNTLLMVAGTMALALPVGILGAILLYRTDLPFRDALRFLAILSLFVPLPLLASGWQAGLGSSGWLPLVFWTNAIPDGADVVPGGTVWKAWGSGLTGAIWIHAVAALPWVVLLVGQGLTWVERELEEDALTRLSPVRVLWSVTLRRSRAALGAAALWVAIQTGTEITVTDMFQVRTYAEEVYSQYVLPEDEAAGTATARAVAVSLPAVALTWLLILLAVRSWERRLPSLRTHAVEPFLFRLGGMRWPLLVGVFFVVAVLAGVPIGSLVWRLGLAGNPSTWSANEAVTHLSNVLQSRGGLVMTSLTVAAFAGGLAGFLALVSSWLATGARWFQAALVVLLAAAWAFPGPTVGLGLKSTIGHLLDLTDSSLLARILYYGPSPLPGVWASLLRFFPCAVALLWPVVRLLPRDLRDAARVEGAGAGQELLWIVLPLTALATLRAALAVMVLSLGELSAGKLVDTPGSQTFAHEVFAQMHYGVTNDLAALCLVLLGTILLLGSLYSLGHWLVVRVQALSSASGRYSSNGRSMG